MIEKTDPLRTEGGGHELVEPVNMGSLNYLCVCGHMVTGKYAAEIPLRFWAHAKGGRS